MAARWSSENVVVEFRDAQATAMSVDCLGQHAVLSGRRFLLMVSLEAPFEAPRKISRQSKWDVGTVQWNPHKAESHVFAASSNQRVDLYSWRSGGGEVHTSLQGHTRVISDLDWSCFEPEHLVTSSVDTYIYIWDTRDTRKPTVALSAVAGASQVKWNRRNHCLLASSHDGDVRIWDKRSRQLCQGKLHEYNLATSSQDNSVRFWDFRQPRKYLNILSCQVPVWKARYTPFSNGLVTVMVPQLRRENSLLLWSSLDLNNPVHAFVGHDDVVLEFQWRPQKEGSKDYQLVTWSRDQTLRIWKVDTQLQKTDMAGDTQLRKVRCQDQDGLLNSTGRHDPSGLPQTLQQEFSLVNLQIRNVNVEMDAVNRSCVVSAVFGTIQVRLVVKFPAHYPNNAAPSFQFVSPTTIPSTMRTKIQKILTDTSLQKVKRNQNCLEPCVRQLVSCLESYMTQEDSGAANPYLLTNPVTPALPAFPRVTNTYGSYQDANIPFPRTSGARFCGTGCLVYFTRPITMHRSVPTTEPTPRSLSALSAYHSGVLTPLKMRTESQSTLRLYGGSPTRTDKDPVSISSFYYKERKSRRFKTKREGAEYGNRPIKLAGKVIIQEISCLLPVHKALGEAYILNVNDIQDTCQKNAAAALALGRRDVVWALASAATSLDLSPDCESDPDTDTPWARHPFGRHLLETLLDHYSKMSDIQTLAMLCSVFRTQGCSQMSDVQTLAMLCSAFRTSGCPQDYFSLYGQHAPDPEHIPPWGESSPDDYRYANQPYTDPREREKELHDMNKKLLDPTNTLQFDDFKKYYGEILHRWGLKEKRAEVLKFISCPPEPHRGIEFGVYCCHCRSQACGTQCAVCKRFTFQCAICHVAVRGSSNFCLSCGHGGHTSHMMEWFRTQDECPTGCGCRCLLQSTF
uniref:RWD domain-containing protein n=1 Tax=Esox lucius TaxID=8010 RepID=A0A3P8YKN9_ESOLU